MQPDVTVLKKTIHRVENKIKCEYFLIHTQQYEGEGIAEKLQGFLDGMKPADIQPVQLVG